MPAPATQLAAMALAIEARLRVGFPAPQIEIRHMPGVASARELDDITTSRTGFIGLALLSVVPDEAGPRAGRYVAGWQLLMGAAASGDAARRFLGDERGFGLYAMAAWAAALLNRLPVEDIGAASIVKWEAVAVDGWSRDGWALGALELAVPFVLEPAPAAIADLPEFLRLNSAWDVPPAAEPDGQPDPTDLLTIRNS
jgi:hypothetical protein